MLKRFFISFLGTLAGIWFSVLIGTVLFFVCIGAAIAAGMSSKQGVKSVEKNSILYIALDGVIEDRESKPTLQDLYYGAEAPQPLNDIVNAINAAAGDKRIKGIFIDGATPTVGLANAQAIVRALDKFRESGKWVISYADNYEQTGYFIACHADSVMLNPVGMINIHGLASQMPYFKGLLDKLGVEMQVIKVGTYKSAVEPYILTSPSEANVEQQTLYLRNIWKAMAGSMAEARGLKVADLDSCAASMFMTLPAEKYVEKKIVDGLRYRHQVEETLCALTDADKYDDLRFVTPSEYCSDKDFPMPKKTLMKVAVFYAVGDIVDTGDEGIAGDKVSRQIFDLMEDDDIDALILRVNSPGGSAFASEEIWEALQQYKEVTGKPFYVSMADYAASGGYYISCGADRIYAEPLTLTGSIGIFGMIPNIERGLQEHLGVNIATVETNRNAAFPTITKPMTADQRAAMQGYVNRGYELFTSRVAKGRHMSVDSVKMIAEGRVWDGAEALKIGLVDRLGGLDMAVADMATELGVSPEKLEVVEYPDNENKWWQELFNLSRQGMRSLLLADEFSPEAMELYRQVSYLSRMNPVQARMVPPTLR